MDKSFKRALLLITFGVVLFVGLEHISSVTSFVLRAMILILPVFIGLLLAFVLNVPTCGFEKLLNKMFSKAKRKPSEKTINAVSAISALLSILLVLVVVVTMMVPALSASAESVSALIKDKWPQISATLKSYNVDVSGITEWFTSDDVKPLIEKITSGTGTVINSVVGAAMSTISGVATAAFSLIISVYVLFSKKKLGRQAQKLIYAYCKKPVADKIISVAVLSRDTYSKFLSGQCIEAVILGSLIFISFAILRLPYAGLIAVLTGFLAFVPYIGAFLACAIGAFFTLIVDPGKVLICVIAFLVVQFVETQFIYPHVVGSSVGLSALWTLVAALVGGKLFGLLGIIFFIPLTSVIYTLLRDETNKRIESKKSLFGGKQNDT